MRTHTWGLFFVVVLGALGAGFLIAPSSVEREHEGGTFAHGWQPQGTFDQAYAKAAGAPVDGAAAGLVAHHLLVADKIAEVFEDMARDDVTTVVIVSPNHFSVGSSPMQTTLGTYTTPYGNLTIDSDAVTRLRESVPGLAHEEMSFTGEHGIAALTPFVKRSFPNAQLVPIILDESLADEDAFALGATIARELPDAVLFASVDMVHENDADFTAYWDEQIMRFFADEPSVMHCPEVRCAFVYPIDSNASLRTLISFANARGATQWTLTHHGSSLAMGATADPLENTSHILGYFTVQE